MLCLYLGGCSSTHHMAPVEDLCTVHVVMSGETLYEIAWRYGKDYRDLVQYNQIRSPDTIYPGQTLHLQPTKKAVLAKSSTVLSGGWVWPVKGKIVKTFSLKGVNPNKGIDLAGTRGTPVCATADGMVVYSGNGLRGYGQLIILKHTEEYLSAYAHNDQILVKEGAHVKQGQIIAKMGQTEADRVKLHFEIRQNGQPIDPRHLLMD